MPRISALGDERKGAHCTGPSAICSCQGIANYLEGGGILAEGRFARKSRERLHVDETGTRLIRIAADFIIIRNEIPPTCVKVEFPGDVLGDVKHSLLKVA